MECVTPSSLSVGQNYGETRGCGGGENDGAGGIVECVTPSSRVATREKNGVQCNKLDKWIPRSSIKI